MSQRLPKVSGGRGPRHRGQGQAATQSGARRQPQRSIGLREESHGQSKGQAVGPVLRSLGASFQSDCLRTGRCEHKPSFTCHKASGAGARGERLLKFKV